MDNFAYPKTNKLKIKSEIDDLFKKGKWMSNGPVRLMVMKGEAETPSLKVGVSVSKKFFKKAVDRNRIKRLLREYYRHNKPLFEDVFGQNASVMLFWVSKQAPKGYHVVDVEFSNLLQQSR